MVRRALHVNAASNALHRLGVTLHVYVDTWAHQGFSGTESNHNKLIFLVGDEHDEQTWLGKLKAQCGEFEDTLKAGALDIISGLGHGAALHFPDLPRATWKNINAHGHHVERNNLPDFIEAADMACKVVQAFVARTEEFVMLKGLPTKAKADLGKVLAGNRDHDEKVRFNVFCDKVAAGTIDGIKEAIPPYVPKGPGSWKDAATGIQAVHDDGAQLPQWSPAFETSDYRKFHDAVKEHRFIVTQEMRPGAGGRRAGPAGPGGGRTGGGAGGRAGD